MKKILSLILTIVLLISMVPLGTFTLTVSAATSYTEDYYTYTVSDGKATITDVYTSISGDITIPDKLGGYPVTSIGDWAFEYCASLTSITIPDSVTSIGDYAFYYCTSLTSITIPDSVTSIGGAAFLGCSSLANVTIGDSVTSIGSGAFCDCSSLTSITIPDSVTSIGYQAFYYCESLTSITIPDSVTSIGYQAFYNCKSLTSVSIPDSVTSIGYETFRSCTSLTSIEVNDGNEYYCDIDGVLFDKAVTTLIQYPAGKTNTSYIIPDSVTSIGDGAFYNCTSLTSVSIGDSVTSIGYSAFYDCTSLTSIIIPDSVTSIGSSAFRGCKSLTSITIPDSVTSIGSSAFSGCTSLTSITIPNSVTSIGDWAFYDCSSLTSITIPDSVTSIGEYAFDDCTSLANVTIGDSVTSIGDWAFGNCQSLTSITIPDSVTSIGSSAFSCCYRLTSITIPDSVTSIGEYAFDDCTSLANVTIGDSVTSIGSHAFYDCESLTSITIPDSVTSIGEYAFDDCTSLANVTIGDSVTSIGYRAFYNCESLTSITIPDSVTSIGNSAFYGCNPIIVCNPNSFAEIYAKEKGFKTTNILTKIEITQLPNKTKYYDGDNIDLTGLEVIVYYYDGTSEIITDYTIGDYDNSVGDEQITVSYKGLTDTFTVNFAAIELSDIGVTALPDNTTQYNEETLDFTGLEVTAFYNNGESKVITDYIIGEYDSTTVGTKTITVSYGGFSDSFEIEVLLKHYRGKCGDNINWSLDPETGTLTLTGSGDMYDYEAVDVPTPWNEHVALIKNLVISDQITHIGNFAFNSCGAITSLTIPDSVESIGEFAFYSCSGILNAKIGAGVKSIGQEAFADCTRLKKVDINDLAKWCGIQFGSNANPLVNGGVLYIDGKITNDIIIPDGVTAIAPNAFEGCVNIKNVTLPQGVTTIGEYAFMKCTSLTSVYIPSTVQTIGKQAFNLCDRLKNVYITDLSSWLTIDFETFNSNPLYIAENLYLNGELLKNLIIPDGTTQIAPMVFYDFQGFDYIYLPASVVFVGEDAFYLCNFETVEFESGTELIMKDTLPSFCTTAAHIIIPDSVMFIEPDTITGSSTQVFGKLGSEAEYYAIENEKQFYKIPVSIEIAQLPQRTTYYKESKNASDYFFSTTGLKIKATYYDGTTEILEDGFKILDRDYPYIQEMATGTHPVKVWFGGKTTTYNITVYSKEIASIAVTELPTKTKYAIGEEFSHQGMTVTLYYKDNSSENIEINGDMIKGFDNTKLGKQTITVEYMGYTDTFEINVVKNLEYISGDINSDGKVNGRDYSLLMQYLNGWDVEIDVGTADVTGDGNVNGRDYSLLMQYLNGWDVVLQ